MIEKNVFGIQQSISKEVVSEVVRHEVKQDRSWFYIQMLGKAIKKGDKVQAMFRHLTHTTVQ